ncbi:hypothetical protein LSP04_01310 [Levilactobacillus spicheri]|uniref:LXG domain-containing protein n=2 Tax=Levilactobacillus spicheri TaxID=216463 RepID=A0ABQ0WKY2_9LACO|nr:hypothetical protein LSP04_01310 [Levilactobacillus spicheri]
MLIAMTMQPELKHLLAAVNLGHSRDHPLAGWFILTILYGDHTGEPQTFNYLSQHYNANYLDTDEKPLTDAILKNVLSELSETARLIEVSPRKVRMKMKSGAFHLQQAPVYRITSQGIEYLTLMPKVLDAESTVTANIARIDEYCALVQQLGQPVQDSTSTRLYNDFNSLLSAYTDVMKGMHKLDEDLDDLANDLAFNHGSDAAQHLQQMLHHKAIPAFERLMTQGPLLQAMANSTTFFEQVARSRQGQDSLDVNRALNDQTALTLQLQQDGQYVQAHLQRLSASFEPTASAIDSSYDSIYTVFQTILSAIQLLGRAYDHIQDQTIDIRELTSQIDTLLARYDTLTIPRAIPKHLAQDRLVSDTADLLNATTMGPVKYLATRQQRPVATAADNPTVAPVDVTTDHRQQGLAEFQRLVMTDATHGRVGHDLEFQTVLARDEIVRLYSATGYDHYQSFAPFGRPVTAVTALPNSHPVWLHYAGEAFSVQLPSGFTITFASQEVSD